MADDLDLSTETITEDTGVVSSNKSDNKGAQNPSTKPEPNTFRPFEVDLDYSDDDFEDDDDVAEEEIQNILKDIRQVAEQGPSPAGAPMDVVEPDSLNEGRDVEHDALDEVKTRRLMAALDHDSEDDARHMARDSVADYEEEITLLRNELAKAHTEAPKQNQQKVKDLQSQILKLQRENQLLRESEARAHEAARDTSLDDKVDNLTRENIVLRDQVEKLGEIGKDRKTLESDLMDARQQINQLRIDLKNKDDQISAPKEQVYQQVDLSRLAELESQLELDKAHIASLEQDVHALENKGEQKDQELESLRQTISNATDEGSARIVNLKNQLEVQTGKTKELEEYNADLEAQVSLLKSKATILQEEINDFRDEGEEDRNAGGERTQNLRRQLDQAKGDALSQIEELSDLQRVLEATQRENKRMVTEMKKKDDLVRSLKGEIDKVQHDQQASVIKYKSAAERLEEQVSALKQVNDTKEELEQHIADQKKAHEDTCEKLNNELQEVRESHKNEMDKLLKEHAIEIEALHAENKATSEKLRASLLRAASRSEANMTDVKEENERLRKQIAALYEDSRTIAQLREQFDTEREEQAKESAAVQKAYETIRAQYLELVQTMANSSEDDAPERVTPKRPVTMSTEARNIESEANTANENLKERKLYTELQAKISALSNQLSAKEEENRELHTIVQSKSGSLELKKEHATLVRELAEVRREKDHMREDYENRIFGLRRAHEEDVQSLRKNFEDQMLLVQTQNPSEISEVMQDTAAKFEQQMSRVSADIVNVRESAERKVKELYAYASKLEKDLEDARSRMSPDARTIRMLEGKITDLLASGNARRENLRSVLQRIEDNNADAIMTLKNEHRDELATKDRHIRRLSSQIKGYIELLRSLSASGIKVPVQGNEHLLDTFRGHTVV
eukprot:Clim_evm95s157 gene=Clim_evmTU95s157